MRDALGTFAPDELRPILPSVARSAIRGKSIAVDVELPFGIISMDGKCVSVPSVDDHYAQRSSRADCEIEVVERISTVTATLCSSEARPSIDVCAIPSHTNDMGPRSWTLDARLEAYRNFDLFRLVTYDAGVCSKATAERRTASGGGTSLTAGIAPARRLGSWLQVRSQSM